MGIESRVRRAGCLECPHEEARDDHQEDADRNLCDDEGMPQTQPRRRLRVVFQRRNHVGFRCLKRRDETREKRGHEHHPGRKDERAAVERERDVDGKRQRRQERDEHGRQDARHGHAGQTAEHEQHQCLGEQLTNQPRPSGAHGEPHGDFSTPGRRAREQHAGDVRARDDQDERDDGQKQDEKDRDRQSGAGHR